MDRERLKVAWIGQDKYFPNDGGYSNLFYEAHSLDAMVIPYREVSVDRLMGYDIAIFSDNKDYRVYDGKLKMIRDAYPDLLIGWRQESEVSNIFRRHRIHGNKGPEEHLDVDPLKVWENCQMADFVIVHNKGDYSESFYKVYADGKPVFALPPFIPYEKLARYSKPRQAKQKRIFVGFHYGWKEGGLMGYIVAGQKKYNDFSLLRVAHNDINNEAMSCISKMIDGGFHKKKVENIPVVDRVVLCKYFADSYIVINLREPTACRTNALCAVAGTPMIGNEQSDVQRLLFPDLCVNKYDLETIDILVGRLINDNAFYDYCVDYAQGNLYKVGVEESSKVMRDKVYKIYNEKRGVKK